VVGSVVGSVVGVVVGVVVVVVVVVALLVGPGNGHVPAAFSVLRVGVGVSRTLVVGSEPTAMVAWPEPA